MTWEALAAVATVVTAMVITITAVAAIVQLRHLRIGNQLEALLTILQMPYQPVIRESLDFVRHDLPDKMKDLAFMKALESGGQVDRTVHKELWVCDYYERIGSFVKQGLISKELYLDNSSPELLWNLVEPVVAVMRRARGPYVYENFEYLAVLARQWDERYPSGNYPRGAPRIDLSRYHG